MDTVTITVTCPEERLSWIKDILKGDPRKVTKKFVRSVAGLLEFLAAVLPFLRAPLGWLHQRLAAFEAGKEVFSASFRVRFGTYFEYIGALLHDWSGSASILSSFASSSSPDLVIYSDASGEVGFGALEMMTRSYGCGIWTEEEIADATRAKAVSSTYLEVLAIIRAVKTFAKPDSTIEVFADSAAAIFILQKRYDRKSEVSQALIISLDRYCRDNGIAIFFTHVPREHQMIQLVDSLSKGSVPLGLKSGGWKRVELKLMAPTLF